MNIARKQIVHGILHCAVIISFSVSLALLAGKSPIAAAGLAQASAGKEVGLHEGEAAPPFHAPDQFGKEQTAASLAGKNGTVLLFFRSADW